MYVVTEKCRGCLHLQCVAVCPAACFHTDGERVFIDPEACVECGECLAACPAGAILTDDPSPAPEFAAALEVNARRAKETPNLDASESSLTPAEARLLEPVLSKLTGKTAAQRRAEARAREAEERRRRREREQERDRRMEEWRQKRAEADRSWVKQIVELEYELEGAMTAIEALSGTQDAQRQELIRLLSTQLIGLLRYGEVRSSYCRTLDWGGDDGDDELEVNEEFFEKAWFVVQRCLDELHARGAALRFEQDETEFEDAEGYSFIGVTRRRLYVGEHRLFAWRQGVVGEGFPVGSGLSRFEADPEPEPGSAIPPASLLHRLGFEEEHPGFPTNYWEALEWAGLDEDEDDEE